MFDGEVFRGRYMEVDYTDEDRAKHKLWFELDSSGKEREISYGDLEAAVPLNPRIRKRRGLPT